MAKTPTRGTPVDDGDPLKKDFRAFLYVIWKHLALPEPTPVQYDIARFMQHGPRRKMIQAFRGVGKTWVYAAFVCWRFYCDPDWKIMVVSASKPYADDFTRFVKRLISEVPILQHLQPGDDQRSSNVFFDVGPARAAKDPSLKSVGIFGQLTGSRADEILADDVESLNNSATEGARQKLSESVKEFDAVLKPNGIVTYLGTPQSAMTMYNKLPERGYIIRVWPAQVPSKPAEYNGTLAPYIYQLIKDGAVAGQPTEPTRFDTTDLAQRELSFGRSGYALQFMLNTSLSDGLKFPLRLSDFITMSLDPMLAPVQMAWATGPDRVVEGVHVAGLPGDRYYSPLFVAPEFKPYSGSVMSIDASGRGKDETSYTVVKHLNGFLFLTAAGGMLGGYEDDTMDALAQIAKAQKVNTLVVESNFGGGMFSKLLQAALKKAEYRCEVVEVSHNTQKERRIIDTLEPVLAGHRLVVCPSVINGDFESASEAPYSLMWQLTHLTKERGSLPHDDRVDALAMAVAYWTDQMALNNQDSYQKHLEKLRDEEFRKFIKEAGGNPANDKLYVRERVTHQRGTERPHRRRLKRR